MLQKILISIIVFVIVLIGLTIGEDLINHLASWIYQVTGFVVYNLYDVYLLVANYVQQQPRKVITAVVVTILICFWIFRSQGKILQSYNNKRKIAVILALFLGWAGVHRFYLNQIGMGLLFLLISWIWLPLSVIMSIIDAIRYLSMTDDDFHEKLKI